MPSDRRETDHDETDHEETGAFDLDRFTPYRLAVVAKRTSEELARQYRDRFGISIPEWRVLVNLLHVGDGTSVRDIEVRAALERYEVSRTAKRLEERGLVEKTAGTSDRRLVSLALTPKGRELVAEILPLARAYQTEVERRIGSVFKEFEAGIDRLMKEDP